MYKDKKHQLSAWNEGRKYFSCTCGLVFATRDRWESHRQAESKKIVDVVFAKAFSQREKSDHAK